MVLTPSTMIALGSPAADFTLPDSVSGEKKSLQEMKSEIATIIMFICNHCPFVIHIQKELVRLAHDYQPRGISFIGISANDVEKYPEDSPERMKQVAQKLGYPFPYLYDESQAVARAYHAACTPDFFIYDKDLKLVYRGQLDDSRPEKGEADGKSIREVLDCILADKPVPREQKASVGCNIKWK